MGMTEEPEKRQLTIDEMLPYIGEYKRYQWALSAIFCLAMFPVAPQVLIMYFAALNPPWRCVENSTLCDFNGTFSSRNTSRCFLPRSEWEFTEPKEYSIVTTFDIHCGNEGLIELFTSIIFVGSACGALVVGWAADNYGRKNVVFVSTGMIILCGFISSFMPNIYAIIVLRFITGCFLCGAYESAILLSEIVACKYRPLAATLIWCFFPISLCVLGMKAYFIRSWNILYIVCSAPYAFILLFYSFAPESPRWLRLNGQMAELTKTLNRIAAFNKKTIPPNLSICPANQTLEKHKTNPLELFRNLKVALLTMNIGYAGFVNAMVYYAFSLLSGELKGTLYTNFILISATQIPSGVAAIILCHRIGRKATTIAGAMGAGIACILLAILHTRVEKGMIVLGMLGTFFITTSFNSLGVWIVELYPTTVRSQGWCFASVITTIGSATAPWMITKLSALHPSAPFICMAVAAISCSLLLLFVKETRSLPTLESDIDRNVSDSSQREESSILLKEVYQDSEDTVA